VGGTPTSDSRKGGVVFVGDAGEHGVVVEDVAPWRCGWGGDEADGGAKRPAIRAP
jgi:hypothetical protein